jgi:hypothetical protein
MGRPRGLGTKGFSSWVSEGGCRGLVGGAGRRGIGVVVKGRAGRRGIGGRARGLSWRADGGLRSMRLNGDHIRGCNMAVGVRG